jgi:hypothetical protein
MGDVELDKLARVYSRLIALKENLPLGEVPIELIDEYHNLLQELEPGFEIEEFKIPPDWLASTIGVTQIDYLSGKSKYGEVRHVPRYLFLTKADALLHYFELLGEGSPKGKTVSFKGPTRR